MVTKICTIAVANATGGNTLTADNKTIGASLTSWDINSTPAVPTTPADGLFVSPSGNDSNDGSFGSPKLTITAGRTALRGNILRKLYVRAGTYTLGSAVSLISSDSGITVINYPGEKPVVAGSIAVLFDMNGCSSVTVQGITFQGSTSVSPPKAAVHLRGGASSNRVIANLFQNNYQHLLLEGATSNVVSGNQMNNATASAIELKDDADNNTIDSNIIDGTGSLNTQGGGVFGHGVANTIVTHNWVKNCVGMGIGFESWDNGTTCTGTQIKFNIVKNSNNSAATNDSGAIYLLGRSLVPVASLIDHNYVSFPVPNLGTAIRGLYLDDGVAGATVTNNIVRNAPTHGGQVHGGGNNTISNNVFDAQASCVSGWLFQYCAAIDGVTPQNMTGNVLTKNIFVSSQPFTSSGGTPRAFSNLIAPATGVPSITNNYFMDGTLGAPQWAQGGISQSGAHYGDVQFTNRAGGDYALKSGSPALAAGIASISTAGMGPQPATPTWYAPVGALSTMI